jgi:hypothetical protein
VRTCTGFHRPGGFLEGSEELSGSSHIPDRVRCDAGIVTAAASAVDARGRRSCAKIEIWQIRSRSGIPWPDPNVSKGAPYTRCAASSGFRRRWS